MSSPVSMSEATEIVKQFEYLKGKSFEPGAEPWFPIEAVAVAPWDDINKRIFIEYYKTKKNPREALRFYQGPYYDVIVICCLKESDWYVFKDIASYCKEHKIKYVQKQEKSNYSVSKWMNH
jgi:hypothetical protein